MIGPAKFRAKDVTRAANPGAFHKDPASPPPAPVQVLHALIPDGGLVTLFAPATSPMICSACRALLISETSGTQDSFPAHREIPGLSGSPLRAVPERT